MVSMSRLRFAAALAVAFAVGGIVTRVGLPWPHHGTASAPAPTFTLTPEFPAPSDAPMEPLDRRLEQMLEIYR